VSRVAWRVPAWEAFPELNRVVVVRLLGLLVERITAGEHPRVSRDGGEGGERASRAGTGADRR
jgi:hypothetical protein